MAKDPAFLFYPSDWDGGTKLFTRAQKGAYMDLLMCQFHSGHMTSHDVAHVLGQNDFDAMWESKLKAKFQQDEEGNFFNQRLEDEQLRRKKWCASRNNNKQGSNQYNGHMTCHTGGHMVNRDENGIAKNLDVAYLVMISFVGERMKGYEINHIDGNSLNNRLSNLEYTTRLENARHAQRLGLLHSGTRTPWSKLKENDVIRIRKEYKNGIKSQKILSNIYKVSISTISSVIRNETYKNIGEQI